MLEILLRDKNIVGNFRKPYIIAEVNSSHNGSIETAKEMIKKVKDAGCDCVKFQSWSAETLYSKTYYDKNPISKRIVDKFAISDDHMIELAKYSKEIGISFASTPYSKAEVDVLVDKIHVPFIKIASMEINNYGYLTYIAKKGIPVILSTGMSDMDEIRKAVKAIEEAGNKQIVILHCVSVYPASPEIINLNNITTLQKEFPNYAIGYSDHTLGTEVASASIALGSAVIEKHFTLDKSKMGLDNNMAIEPSEMKALVNQCHNVYNAMGSKERIVSDLEKTQRLNMRRSIIALRDMKQGEIIKESDVDFKRPGNGIAPEFLPKIIGKKLVNDIEADCLIFENDIK
jgi:sialic acid synthase SpsE